MFTFLLHVNLLTDNLLLLADFLLSAKSAAVISLFC